MSRVIHTVVFFQVLSLFLEVDLLRFLLLGRQHQVQVVLLHNLCLLTLNLQLLEVSQDRKREKERG